MGLLPRGGVDAAAQIGGAAEYAAQKTACHVCDGGDGTGERGCEARSMADAATIAEKLELEALLGGEVVVVAGELDLAAHVEISFHVPVRHDRITSLCKSEA